MPAENIVAQEDSTVADIKVNCRVLNPVDHVYRRLTVLPLFASRHELRRWSMSHRWSSDLFSRAGSWTTAKPSQVRQHALLSLLFMCRFRA